MEIEGTVLTWMSFGADSGNLERGTRYWDDVSGQVFDSKLVEEARRNELKDAEAMGAWKKVPKTEAYSVTDKAPIGTRLVDTDKGDPGAPKVRSRFVAQERMKTSYFDLFVAAPPIEDIKVVISLVASSHHGRRSCLIVHDTKEALAYAPALRYVYVALPCEAPAPGGSICLGS